MEDKKNWPDKTWAAITYIATLFATGIAASVVWGWGRIVAVSLAIWAAIMFLASGFFRGIWFCLCWLFEGVRPLRIVAFLAILLVGTALIYVNANGAWQRTGDKGYTAIIIGIEMVVLVALPIIFAVRGWFTTPVAIAIFISGIAIASFNAKPALENILTRGEGVVDPQERIAQAQKLEDEVYGYRDPDTGERIKDSGMLALVMRQEADASRNRTELGHTTASAAVEAEAALRRTEITNKLQMAEQYRAEAKASSWASQLAIITFVVAELIRSFGLKVLVGFEASGTGHQTTKGESSLRQRRKGILRKMWSGLRRWLWGDPGYQDRFADDDDFVKVPKDRLEELEQREKAAKEGGKKAARTRRRGNKIEQTEQYARDKIAKFMELKNKGMATSDIAKEFGLTVSSMKVGYESYMTPEEFDHLFNSKAVAIVDPQPAQEPEPEMSDSSESQDADDSEDEDGNPAVAAE